MKRKKNRENLKMFFYTLCTFYLLVYAFFSLKIIHIGYKIAKVKEEYEYLSLLNKNYNLQFTKLITPENIEKLAKEKNIILTVPKDWCFLKVKGENENLVSETWILEAGTR
ncbi:MAG: hypothetical protein NC915_03395 [Candidatus Omnitrophica bacterium]|nr:hypothetical protein [Candidatus Omnitrophota bacterium]